MKEQVERRKDRRCELTPGVRVAFGPQLRRVGQITDISGSGLSFRYAGYRDSSKSSELDVLSAHFCLLKVPFESIFDFEMGSEFFLGSIPIRRRGVRFRNLTSEHRSELRRVIQECTPGKADA